MPIGTKVLTATIGFFLCSFIQAPLLNVHSDTDDSDLETEHKMNGDHQVGIVF